MSHGDKKKYSVCDRESWLETDHSVYDQDSRSHTEYFVTNQD